MRSSLFTSTVVVLLVTVLLEEEDVSAHTVDWSPPWNGNNVTGCSQNPALCKHTHQPTAHPTKHPSPMPTPHPTPKPPTMHPTAVPTNHPTPHPTPQPTPEEIVKSKRDARHYRRLSLDNGVDVMLIQSPSYTCGVAVDVATGWWHDPVTAPGMAHFLEHMLFLGTKKYPDEDGWRDYLSQYGGSSNAYTSSLNVNYYFSISSSGLQGAIERFAQFFVEPMLTPSALSREVRAVNAEHVKNQQNDGWRVQQLFSHLANSSMAYSGFSTGNMATLANRSLEDLHGMLVNFYQQYYTAPNIRVAVQGHVSLNTMEKWVRQSFSAVPRTRNVTAIKHRFPPSLPNPAGSSKPRLFPYVDQSTHVFSDKVKGHIVQFRPVKHLRYLTMTWCIPPQLPHYQGKAIQYIASLLSDEGTGSIISILRNKGWAVSISANTQLQSGAFDLFQVRVGLTHLGLLHTDDVMWHVFRHVRLIEEQGLDLWRWQEMAELAVVDFLWTSLPGAASYASRVSAAMPRYPIHRDILMAQHLYRVWNRTEVQGLLKLLVPKECIVMVAHQNPHGKYDHKEPFYGTQYSIEPVSLTVAQRLKSARFDKVGDQHLVKDKLLHHQLPGRNMFIPRKLKMKDKPSLRMPYYPLLIENRVESSAKTTTGSVRVWWKQDTRFKIPEGVITCKFWTPHLYATPRDVVMATLYSRTIQELANERIFAASVSGYTFSFTSSVDGFNLRLSGYDEHLVNISKIVSPFLQLQLPGHYNASKKGVMAVYGRFRALKETVHSTYTNFIYGQPYSRASYLAVNLLSTPHWQVQEYIKALDFIELDDMVRWAHAVYQDMALECLVMGNMYEHEARLITNSVAKSVDFRSVTMYSRNINAQLMRIAQMDGAYEFHEKTQNRAEQNSAAYVYYQYEGIGNSTADDMFIRLVSGMMRKAAFNQLRTKEALGYLVFSGPTVREGVNGLHVTVQSPKKSAKYLHNRIVHFMEVTLRKHLHSLSAATYRSIFLGAARSQLYGWASLHGESTSFWKEITTQQYNFVSKQHVVAELLKMTKPRFLKWYDDLIGYRWVPSRLSIQIQAQTGDSAGPDANKPSKAQGVATALQGRVKHINTVDNGIHLKRSLRSVVKAANSYSPSPISRVAARQVFKKKASLELKLQNQLNGKLKELEDFFDPAAKEKPLPEEVHNVVSYAGPEAPATHGVIVDEGHDYSLLEIVHVVTKQRQRLHCRHSRFSLPNPLCKCFVDNKSTRCEQWRLIHAMKRRPPVFATPVLTSASPLGHHAVVQMRKLAASMHNNNNGKNQTANSSICKEARLRGNYSTYSVCNGTMTEIEHKPCPSCTVVPTPAPSPPPPDDTCNKSGERKFYKPRTATSVNIREFKDAMCLFPKRAIGTFVPTLQWWEKIHERTP